MSNDPAATLIGAAVRARRKSLGITQEDLASLAGVSARFLGELERGKPTIRLDSLLSVCAALGLTIGVR